MGEWKVSVWSDAPAEQAVVRSMLAILRGNAVDRWSFSDSADANLLLVGTSLALPPKPAVDVSRIVARLLEPGETAPGNESFTVQRPLRAMPFLDLLNEASQRLEQLQMRAARAPEPLPETGAETDTAPLDDHAPLLEAAQELQLLRYGGDPRPVALVGRDGMTLALINIGRAAVASAHSLDDLVDVVQARFSRIEPVSAGAWDKALPKLHLLSLDALSWRLGMRLSRRFGMAPWLRREEPYRLKGWPDFGAIGTDRIGFKLAAQLTRRALTPLQLSAACAVSFSEATAFLNSASLCGLVVAGPAPAHPGRPAVQPAAAAAPERRSMIARLRSKLGL